jgi:hypothetical protein
MSDEVKRPDPHDGKWTGPDQVVEYMAQMERYCNRLEARLREAMELMTTLVGVVDAHDIDSLSCDRDGEECCDCLSRAVGNIQAFLASHKENT